jgi:hypothetical protein
MLGTIYYTASGSHRIKTVSEGRCDFLRRSSWIRPWSTPRLTAAIPFLPLAPFAIEHPSLQFFPSVSGSPFPLRAFQRQFLESPPLGQGAVC